MTRNQLIQLINTKKSFLSVGLDADIDKIPQHLKNSEDPVFEFNKAIIDSTIDYAVAFKLNLAFYESIGHEGWLSFEKTIEYLKKRGNIFTIADAKRSDIGNTATHYAKAFFENLGFDAVTVNPFMGYDAVVPFLKYKDKFTIILALTSNAGSSDFQMQYCGNKYLYEEVIVKSAKWASPDQIMYVIGATKADVLKNARELVPDNFFLVPGVGAQGGDLQSVCKHGMNDQCGLLINSSRSIIFSSQDRDFAEKAGESAFEIQKQMEIILNS